MILSSALLCVGVCLPLRAQVTADSCEGHDWFALRQQATMGTSLLCKGILDSAFEKRNQAERELSEVIRNLPRSESSRRAHQVLGMMFFRKGRYRAAEQQLEEEAREELSSESEPQSGSLFTALARFPDLTIAKDKPSVVHGETQNNNLFLPVTVNGVSGFYIADSGANISIMCESEARRLGLSVDRTDTKLWGAGAMQSAYGVKVVDAANLWIGRTHLRHVAFLVIPDSSMPFVELPEGHKGILGIPVLIALRSIRLDKGGVVEIHPAEAANGQELPLAFDDAMPVTQMSMDGKAMSFTFDTGADTTYLYGTFAALFPELMETGSRQESAVRGFAGNANEESVELPSLKFSLGREVELKPARVLLKGSVTAGNGWAAGNLGFDLISQAIPITIDFQAMRLIVEAP